MCSGALAKKRCPRNHGLSISALVVRGILIFKSKTGNSFPSLPRSENGTTAPTCFIWGLSLCSSIVCMTITPHLFEAYLKCPTKCFLRSLGETGAGNPYADWVCAQNTFFRREGIRRLKEGVANDERSAGPLDRKELKSTTWRLATESRVCAQNLECTLHAVERVPSDTPGKSVKFIPSRFIFTNKLAWHDKLLLAFDALVLSEALGQEVALGKIIHGDDFATLKSRPLPWTARCERLPRRLQRCSPARHRQTSS